MHHTQGEQQAEREGEAGSLLSKEPDVGFYPRIWDHDLSQRQMLNRLSTRRPGSFVFIYFCAIWILY